jgi:acyl-CoA synthetase (AMP-forming)/AMP-acid ligase II
MNTADYLLMTGADQTTVVIADGASYSYADLRAACKRMVGELLDAGVRANDRVGILGNNSFAWIVAYLALLKIGALAVPIPHTATPPDVASMLTFVGCKIVCVDRRSVRRFTSAFTAVQTLVMDDVLAKAGTTAWPEASISDDADAVLMFTSGTTGKPRAVRVTPRNIQANTDAIIDYLQLTSAERILVVLPFCYCYGTSLLHTHLRAGGTLVLSNTFTYPETVLDLMEATQCTGFAGVPSTFQTLLRNSTFSKRELHSLRKIQQAGGKLPIVLIQELIAAAREADLYVMYGQTEATARLSYLPPDVTRSKMGSIGRGIPGVTLRVLNDAGAEVQPGEVGEIYAWGDSITPGYYNEPEATAMKFVAGALRTGDMATVDADGYIYITDRKSDFIKSYGHRVSSQQVEACVMELPDVIAAAAIGELDLTRGEAIKVFVTLHKGSTLAPADIIAHCVKTMAHHMVPSEVIVVDRLPLNAHGKVIKAELKGWVPQSTTRSIR